MTGCWFCWFVWFYITRVSFLTVIRSIEYVHTLCPQRERERETERDRERQRETERDRERQRQTDRHTETDIDRQRHTNTDRDTDRQTQTDRQTETQTDRQTDMYKEPSHWRFELDNFEVRYLVTADGPRKKDRDREKVCVRAVNKKVQRKSNQS